MRRRWQELEVPAVLLLLSLAFSVVAVPFVLSAADSWDMVGHLAHAELQRQMLPQLVFWNPYFFSGYEQFTAYPPLLSLLVAGLSLPMGLVAAFKLVTVTVWVALPASIFYLYRGLLSSRLALVATSITALLLVLVSQQIGGTFYSTLVVGNVANTLGLVFFALCLGAVLRDEFRKAIPLLALLVLTHMIAAVVLSLFLGLRLLLERRGGSILLGYGMAAFWLLPALFGTYRDVSAHDDYPLSPLEVGVSLAVLIGYAIYRRRSPDRRADAIVLGLAVLLFLVGFLRALAPQVWSAVPMHFHRVKVYSLVLTVPVLLRIVERLVPWRSGNRMATLGPPLLALLAMAVLVPTALTRPLVWREPYRAPDLQIDGERVLTVEEVPEIPYWHNLRHHLAAAGHRVTKGLFIEASPDAPYLLSLEQILDAEHQVPLRWGIDWDTAVMADPEVEERSSFLLDLFGVQAVVSDRPIVANVEGPRRRVAGGFTVIERPWQPLVDVPRYPLKFSGGPLDDARWQTLVRQWFLAGEELLVVDAQPFAVSADGRASLSTTSNHLNSLAIEVDAESPVPVLVRVGFSSKWRARADGRPLPVFRVTPNNLMVLADRDFELRFQPLGSGNWVALIVSLASLLGFLVLVRRQVI